MFNRKLRTGLLSSGLVIAAGAGLALLAAGCSGNTDGGSAGDVDYSGSEFVGTDANTGSINLLVNQTSLPVADMSGFRVTVTNAAGRPVPDMRVSCDTEDGVGIIEPNTGTELTDGNGQISGVVGCEAPGSFRMGCRLPVGVNKRQFVTVRCAGPVPAGFSGFPGAAGGGLGTGGVGTGNSSEGVAITSITFSDAGDDNTLAIDLAPTQCDEDTWEGWVDAHVTITVVNNSSSDVTFGNLIYTVPEATGDDSSDYTTPEIAVSGQATISGDGGESSFTFVFMEATGTGKEWVGGSGVPSNDLGVRNILFELTGTNALGEDVVVSGSQSARFDDYNTCD